MQGTAFLVGRGDEILTNAHIFVDEIGRDRANLGKCFWQNKEEPFRRVPLHVTSETVKLFTRSTNEEFYLDLAVVRLEGRIPDTHPFRFDPAASVELGDRLTMISAGQLRMPSLPKQETEIIRVDPDGAFEFDFNREPIAQSCVVRAVGKKTDRTPNDAIYSDCSATRGRADHPSSSDRRTENSRLGASTSGADKTPLTTPSSPWISRAPRDEVILTHSN